MGPPKVCFEHQMSWSSIFEKAFSVLISFKILVGNVPHSILGRCCVGISFFPSLFFLLLTQKLGENGWNSNWRAFSFVFTKVHLRKHIADLLHFILHRNLSVTSVKKVCCQNGIPHTLRDELTCGSFQLSICRLTITRIVFKISWYWRWQKISSFSPNLKKKEKIRSWRKSFEACQILKQKFPNASDFELKFLQRVTFWKRVSF